MAALDTLTNEQKEAIDFLRLRMKSSIAPETYDDILMFYRFLKAREFNIDKAEQMLKKHLAWRKAYQVDIKRDTFVYSEVFKKYLIPALFGYDKVGGFITYVPAGKLEMRNLLKGIKMNDFLKNLTIFGERALKAMAEENKKTGRCSFQGILILDLEKLTFANATNRQSIEFFLRLSQNLQDNFPEQMKACYIINAPAYYVVVYAIVKKFMSNAMAQKMQVFGQNGWKEELLKCIDADVLPAFLGGNRTDPDGNQLCLSFVIHGAHIPSNDYLTNEERWFKDSSQVKKVVVPPSGQNKVSVEVEQTGSVIEWEFESKNKDIGFGLFFQDLEEEIEILPIIRFSTADGTETGNYKAQWSGTYTAVFDNSYSWISSKEVRYCITVTKPTAS